MIQKQKAPIEQAASSNVPENCAEKNDEFVDNLSYQAKKKIHSLPIFETLQNKTDKTDFSGIGNSDFIAGVFGEISGTTRPVVVSFPGNPGKVKSNAWFGKPYIEGETLFPEDHNHYTSFATFNPDDEGKYRRKKKHFAALRAIMLDDVGVKVETDRITLEPSWQIETSLGNFQVGFILAKPITDPAIADCTPSVCRLL